MEADGIVIWATVVADRRLNESGSNSVMDVSSVLWMIRQNIYNHELTAIATAPVAELIHPELPFIFLPLFLGRRCKT